MKPKEKKRVTIAAGFVAEDGVLICTDSLYSGGVNMYGRKIFTHKYGLDGVVSFALAGHEPLAKKTINDCDEIIRENPEYATTVDNIRKLIEQTVKNSYEQYVDKRPLEERETYQFQLLIAVATGCEGASLFRSSGPVVSPVETFECIGAGGYVGHHIIQNAYRPRMKLEQVATIAIHAMGVAKRYVEGVGGPSQFECIKDTAVTETLSQHFPYDLATMMDMEITSYENEVATLLSAVANSELGDDAFTNKVNAFVEFVNEMRGNWKKYSQHSTLYKSLRSSK